MMSHPKYFSYGFCSVGLLQRFVKLVCVGGAFAYFVLVVGALWGTWNLVAMSPDTPNYLLPSAAALFEGRWDHVGRPFGYPAIAYLSIWVGGSLNALVVLQLALYVLSGLLVYVAVQIPFRSGSRADGRSAAGIIVAPLFAAGATIAYFLLSSRLLASAFYLLPEFVSSAAALGALTLCLILMIDRMHRPAYAAALATTAAGCAAMLISFKPSMSGTAGLTLILASWGLIHQSYRASRSLIIYTLVAMVAMPSAVLVIDSHLVRKYRDFESLEFGALSAFCNNAPLIVRNLEISGTTGNRLLGEDGSRKVAHFLRETMARTPHNFPIQGFKSDECLWPVDERRRELERKYFGTTRDEVVQTYQRLMFASVTDAPGSYALRFARQMKAYLVSDQVTCSPDREWNDRSYGSYPLVDRLIQLYATDATAQALPAAPGADMLCTRLAPLLNLLHLPVIAVAFMLTILQGIGQWRPRRDTGAQAVLLSTTFWMSGAVVVALVETFDRQRYLTVMFPVYIVAIAIAGAYLLSTVIRSLSVRYRNFFGST